MSKQLSSAEVRIVRFLKQGGCEIQDSVRDNYVLLVNENGSIAASRKDIEAAQAKGLLCVAGQKLALSKTGRQSTLRKTQPSPKKERVTQTVEIEKGKTIEVNLSESPLASLYRRKGANGEAFLTDDEFRAGERLRADFTRGSLMPSITSRWDTDVRGNGHSGAGGVAELTDIALASRIRVERALTAVGPELSGVLVDICCFLKGLERVERERRWPVRSAKMLLKTGLSILHRHYNPVQENTGQTNKILHWGSEGYRPDFHSREG